MITAYLVGTSSHYEGEDIEIRFNVFENENLLFKEEFFKEYAKPALVEHVALLELLKRLEPFKGTDIKIMINNGSLYQQIKGTLVHKNWEVVRMTRRVVKEIDKFRGSITIKDVSSNKEEFAKWKEIVKE